MRVKQPEQFDPERNTSPANVPFITTWLLLPRFGRKPHNGWQIVPEPCFVNGASVVGLDGTFAPGRICIAISTTEPTERRYFGG